MVFLDGIFPLFLACLRVFFSYIAFLVVVYFLGTGVLLGVYVLRLLFVTTLILNLTAMN